MCSDSLVALIETQKLACERDSTKEKKIEIPLDQLAEEDFEYLHNCGYDTTIAYDLTCLRLDPRIYAGFERDSCNERWIVSWD